MVRGPILKNCSWKAYSQDRPIFIVFKLNFPPTPRRLSHWHCLGKDLWVTQNFSIEMTTLPYFITPSNSHTIHAQATRNVGSISSNAINRLYGPISKPHNFTKPHALHVVDWITVFQKSQSASKFCESAADLDFSFHFLSMLFYLSHMFSKWALNAALYW